MLLPAAGCLLLLAAELPPGAQPRCRVTPEAGAQGESCWGVKAVLETLQQPKLAPAGTVAAGRTGPLNGGNEMWRCAQVGFLMKIQGSNLLL